MAFQGGRNLYVNFKSQSVAGTLATGGVGATRFRVNEGSPGMNLSKATINSNENRGDGMSTRGRHGSHVVQGSYGADLSVGTFDAIFEAILRGTWSAAATVSDADSLGALSVASNVITFATGGLTALAKTAVGDILTWASGVHADDVNKRMRITAQTNTTLTVERIDGTALTNVAGPVATYSATRAKRLIQGTTRRAFTIEEHEIDIDGSELFDFCRFSRLDIGVTPDNMGILTIGAVGRTASNVTGGSAPYFTGETPTSTLGLAATQAKIKLGSSVLLDVTDFQLSLDLRAAAQPVVGSPYTPDVFDNNAQITARITGLRQDFTRFADFLAETALELHLFFGENESAPEDFVNFAMTNLVLSNPSKSALGQDGARTQSFDLIVGANDAGGAYLKSMLQIATSAA